MRLFATMMAMGILASTCQAIAYHKPKPSDTIALVMHTHKTHTLYAKIAADERTCSKGLMFVKSMPANQGMLFVFDQDQQPCFWMKNTHIPLSLAYLDSTGMIVQLADMTPFDLTSHCATVPVRYALEVNQGYFKERNIGIGTRIDFQQ